MAVILLFAVIIVGIVALAVAGSGNSSTVVERPAAVQAQIFLIRAEIILAEAKMAPAPPSLPKARAFIRTSTAIERYRSHGRSPS